MKIARKMQVFVILPLAVVAMISGVCLFIVSANHLKTSILNHMRTTAKSRMQHMESILDEHRQIVEVLASAPIFEKFLGTSKTAHDYSRVLARTHNRINEIINIHDEFFKICILDKTGKLVVSSWDNAQIGADRSGLSVFLQAKDASFINDMEVSLFTGKPGLVFAAPILQNDEFMGMLLAEFDGKILFQVLMESTGLGETGESYLINQNGYMITPSRFVENAPLNLKVDTTNAKNCLAHIDKRHHAGHVETEVLKNYRGQNVLGTHEYNANMQWGLLVEIAEKEVLAPLKILKIAFVFILVLFPIIAWSVGGIISKMVLRPVLRLQRGAEIIANGNLNHRVGSDATDEIGQLSKAFDTMTKGLRKTTTSIETLEEEIYQRKKSEEKLSKSQEKLQTTAAKLQTLVTAIPDLVVIVDENGTITFSNDALSRVTGYDKGELLGTNMLDFISPGDQKRALENVMKTYGQKTGVQEYDLILKSGNTHPFEINADVILDRQGAPAGMLNVCRDIAQRKQAEKTLQEGKKKLEFLTANMADIIWSADMDLNLTYVSPTIEKIAGYTPLERMQQKMEETVTPESFKHIMETFQEQLQMEGLPDTDPDRIVHIEVEYRHKNGTMVWLDNRVKALRDETGSLMGITGVSRDITERRRVEVELNRQTGLITSFFYSIPDIIFLKDIDGVYLGCNPAFAEFVGRSVEEITGNTDYELFDRDTADFFRSHDKQMLEKFEKRHNEEWITYPDGRKVLLDTLKAPYLSPEGEPLGVLGISRDITELNSHRMHLEHLVKKRTKELKQSLLDTEKSRDRIDGILKSVGDGLIVTDQYNRVVLMNHAAEKMLKIRLSEVVDRPVEFAIQEKTLRDRVKDTMDNKQTGYQFDFELPGTDLKIQQVMRARTSAIQGRQDMEAGTVTIISDVTQERELDRMKTEFISTAAHELRTPLTSIQGFSEILLTRDTLSPGEKRKFLMYINDQAVGLAAIIADLLDISRIESGKGFSLNIHPCDMDGIIRRAISPFKDNHPAHHYEVILQGNSSQLEADPDKLEQVMQNLLSNATKYSPAGGRVQVSGEMLDGWYQISVSDQGLGMTPKQVEKIYDKFYRANSSDTDIEGTGLGMSIVKYIVEAHGGKVQVESELTKGTTVRCSIPLKV